MPLKYNIVILNEISSRTFNVIKHKTIWGRRGQRLLRLSQLFTSQQHVERKSPSFNKQVTA